MTPASAEIAPDLEPLTLLNTLGYRGTRDVIRIRGGWDTLLWRFGDTAGRLRSLRVYWLPDRDEAWRKEEIALRHCEWAGFPAPRIEAACRIHDMPVAVLSWLPGRPLLSDVERRPWRLGRLSRLLGETQALLHSTEPPEEFRSGAPRSWTGLVQPGFEYLAEELASLNPGTSSFIHMDFHPLNVLADDARLTGVVDWAGAAAGDPRADLARTEVTIETAPIPPGPMRPVLAGLRRLMLRGWREGYRSAAGSMPDYRPFRRWAAASLLREVSRVVGRPDVWAEPAYLGRLQDIAAGAKRRPGRQAGGAAA
jgi:aminoglycoside phosphotransferase (APT) family kinase protein